MGTDLFHEERFGDKTLSAEDIERLQASATELGHLRKEKQVLEDELRGKRAECDLKDQMIAQLEDQISGEQNNHQQLIELLDYREQKIKQLKEDLQQLRLFMQDGR
jgi:hypothetical protein